MKFFEPDPKFGYHVYWMVPVSLAILSIWWLKDNVTKIKHKAQVYRWNQDPELKRLRDNAGLND